MRAHEAFICTDDCPVCDGRGTVCESHPGLPWGGLISDGPVEGVRGCWCGAPGMPCLVATISERDDRIRYLEAGLDAIARHHNPGAGCLSTCAANSGHDDDCDCGYEAADDVGDFAADVVAGEAELGGAMRLDEKEGA